MKQIHLTEEEKTELKRLHRKNRDGKERDKIKAILLYEQGYTRKEIAKILLIQDEDTITRWRDSFLSRKSLEEWLQNNCTGYSGRLDEAQLKVLEEYVEKNLITNANEVRVWILDRWGIEYTVEGVHSLLHRLGFSYKQVTPYPSKMDPVDQADFKEFYEDLLENLPEEAVVLFIDGVHPQHNTQTVKAWIKEGHEKHIPTNTGRKRININGAYNPLNQDFIYREEKTINADSTILLFQDIEAHYPEAPAIYVIRDNAKYYFNEKVEKYLENSRIETIPLPTYSPNLNLIERFWKFMKKKAINTHYYEKFDDFKKAVLGFLDNTEDHKDEIRQFIGTKLHLLQIKPV